MARDSAGEPEESKAAEKGAPVEGSVRSGGGPKDASAEASVLGNGCCIELSAKPSATGTADRTLGDAEQPVAAVRAPVQHASAEAWRRESLAQRRVDALGLLAEAALGKGLAGMERGEPFQVMIHVDADVLAGRSDDGRCELEGGEGISAETCRRLACDAPHVTVGQDADGNVLHLGRKARKISTPLWRALMSRDRTCRFPGCTRTRHLQAHHIEHWAEGGETNPGNLLMLCRLCRARHNAEPITGRCTRAG